ncbi:hypothetical protein G7Y89_g13528 [Cudoniella acicularis]|uniref:Uncharacterized protein n=1 Tax=Cudoniella acicularis TaxID=354080 RepID=A0A8H4VVY7_9HELO|nr:hypothetical protein G7Y89_g13528 [Cudoniella acicularis]
MDLPNYTHKMRARLGRPRDYWRINTLHLRSTTTHSIPTQIKSHMQSAHNQPGHADRPIPFLDLPIELRNQIYEYALHIEKPVKLPRELYHAFTTAADRQRTIPKALGICLVNKQIHEESTYILYSKNVFAFFDSKAMLQFERSIGSRNRSHIRCLQIKLRGLQFCSTGVPSVIKNLSLRWADVLSRSQLQDVAKMIFVGNVLHVPSTGVELLPELAVAVIDFFARSNLDERVPALTLANFTAETEKMFPAHWSISQERYDE